MKMGVSLITKKCLALGRLVTHTLASIKKGVNWRGVPGMCHTSGGSRRR